MKRIKEITMNTDIELLYEYLRNLEAGIKGKRPLSECNGRQPWPKQGVYFFFHPEESRKNNKDLRVVRVGTHGVSLGSRSTLWERLRAHRGTSEGSGNHRSSIFRLHVGEALMNRCPELFIETWGKGSNANFKVRSKERELERRVSKYIGSMSVLYLSVTDVASSSSDRAYIERNTIGLLSCINGNEDRPSKGWLGLDSSRSNIRESGSWNLDYVQYQYDPGFLDVFKEYVSITLGKTPKPDRSLAPPNWKYM
jgi:hypothetical protein